MSGHTYSVFILIKPTFEPAKEIFHSHANIKLVIGPEVSLVDLPVCLYSRTLPRIPFTLSWSVKWYLSIYSTAESSQSGIRNVGVPISLSKVKCSMPWAGLSACCYLPKSLLLN